jgi:hypothetical protein
MIDHREIIQLVIGYTLVGAFVFTVVITCLSTIGVIRLPDKRQQRKLFAVLLVEVAAGCVAFFLNFIQLDPGRVEETIEGRAKTDLLVATIRPEMSSGSFSPQNPAAVAVWSAFGVLFGTQIQFDKIATIRLAELPFFNNSASEEIRRAELGLVAGRLDAFWRQINRARYQRGIGNDMAHAELVERMVNGETTVAEFAETVGKLYVFPVEWNAEK